MLGFTETRIFLARLSTSTTSPFGLITIHVRFDRFLKKRFKIRTLEQCTAVKCGAPYLNLPAFQFNGFTLNAKLYFIFFLSSSIFSFFDASSCFMYSNIFSSTTKISWIRRYNWNEAWNFVSFFYLIWSFFTQKVELCTFWWNSRLVFAVSTLSYMKITLDILQSCNSFFLLCYCLILTDTQVL